MKTHTKTIIAVAVALVAFGCGGTQKGAAPTGTGLGDGKVPPPPDPDAVEGGEQQGTAAEDISNKARKAYDAAIAKYKEAEAAGWTDSACTSLADTFTSIGQRHDLVEGRYMAGLAYQKCQMDKRAEKEYQAALQINAAHARSLSNLGEIYFRAGKESGAKKYWDNAIKADAKLTAARNNLAWLLLEQLRETDDRSTWNKIEKEARDHLSAVLAVDSDNVRTYVLYGLVYMEGHERNKNRLDLANLLLEEGEKRSKDYAPLWNAKGLLQLHKNNLGNALSHFTRAIELDPEFAEAHMNVGNITLGFRKYDQAEASFGKVLQLEPKNYLAHIGLGVAKRGLKDLDAAESEYKKALDIDKNRGEAYFNLGVLYKDFRANNQPDLKGSIEAYKEARGYFRKFLSKKASQADQKEAEANIGDLDKIITDLEKVLAAQAGQS